MNKENKYISRILTNFYKALDLKNEKEFINYLLNYDLLFDEVKKKIIIEAAWNDLIYTKYIDKIKIDEQKIKKKINKIISDKKSKTCIYFQKFCLMRIMQKVMKTNIN